MKDIHAFECGTSLAEQEFQLEEDGVTDSVHRDVVSYYKTLDTISQDSQEMHNNKKGSEDVHRDENSNKRKIDEHYWKKLDRLHAGHDTSNLSSAIHVTPQEQNDALHQLRSFIASDVITCRTVSSPFENKAYLLQQHPTDRDSIVSIMTTTTSSNCPRYMSLPLVYCDQTASNRALHSIESYISQTCLPLYGNTHTNTSLTGSQSTAFVAEARQIIAESVNAKITGKASLDLVLFAGSGSTSVVQLLLDCIGLHDWVTPSQQTRKKPVVFVGPYEHHSNLLPWRESGVDIITVPECPIHKHDIDYSFLEDQLQHLASEKDHHELQNNNETSSPSLSSHRLVIGTFTAVSNVTGKVCDVDRIASLLHKYHALAFFDYATAAPYLAMDMNPTTHPSAYKDAIFLSPHKMIGGINTPGVLVIKKDLVHQSRPPHRSGGGTVFYVTHDHHRFLSNRVERYEGGTPNVIGIIRAGLVFLHRRKSHILYGKAITTGHKIMAFDHPNGSLFQEPSEEGTKNLDSSESRSLPNHSLTSFIPLMEPPPKTMTEYEYETHRIIVQRLAQTSPNIILLGQASFQQNASSNNARHNHIPIFSFLIKCGSRFLHYNYVCAILNDLFGIQSRGGCQCSGPYSQYLLGLTTNDKADKDKPGPLKPNSANQRIESALLQYKERAELLRPGYTRLSLPFKGLHSLETEYVVQALEWVAKHGWAFMCLYRCNHRTGEWRHSSRQGRPLGKTERRWLSHYDMVTNQDHNHFSQPDSEFPEYTQDSLAQKLNTALQNAQEQLELAKSNRSSIVQALKMIDNDNQLLGGDHEAVKNLDELRWYVYPHEIAQYLNEGKSVVPGTYSLQEITGPIRPIGFFEPGEMNESEILTPIIHENLTKVSDDEVQVNHDALGRFYFRDGECHCGEASFIEIEEGLRDGDLSDAAEIFLSDENRWIRIEEFLTSRKLIQTNCNLSSPSDINAVTTVTENDDILDSHRMEKKQCRDSSFWGKVSTSDIPQTFSCQSMFNGAGSIIASGSSLVSSHIVDGLSRKTQKNSGRIQPPPKLMRSITQAIIQWDMIGNNDRLLLGLSGGKDSLSLLHCLLEYRRRMPVKFDLEICTIDPMTPSFDPSPLIPYVESLGLKYHYIKDDIVDRANSSGKSGKVVSSLCAFCARMKRGNLYTCARRNNCNKLVLAQHLDDCAESFLMSIMHNGFVRTMKANYRINAGDISVIRPMVYCRESMMTEFAKSAKLPVINENCPACFEEPKERARIKKLLARESTMYPNLYDNLRRALIPLLHDESTAIMRCFTEEAVAKSRKDDTKLKKTNKSETESHIQSDNLGKEHVQVQVLENGDECTMEKTSLSNFSDDDLLKELAHRKALRYRLSGAMKRLVNSGDDGDDMIPDPTGQVCTLDGRNGTIQCRDLFE